MWIGIIGSFPVIVSTITNPFAGFAVDKLGRKKIYVLGSFSNAIAFYLFAIFSVLFELIILMIFSGIVASMYGVANNSIILDVSPSEKRGQIYGLWGTLWNISFGIGVLLAGWVWEAYAP